MRYTLVLILPVVAVLLMATGPCDKPQPSPTPEPTPTATPTPEPTPPVTTTTTLAVETCKFSLTDVTSFKNLVKPNGGQTLDFTIVACGASAPCNNPDPRMARCCDLSVDKGNGNCAKAEFGEPWWTPDDTVQLDALPPGRSTGGYTHKISEGDGYVTICGSVSMNTVPGACIRFHVFKGVPACDMNTDPAKGCVLQ